MIAGETAQLSQRLVVLVYELHDKVFVIWLAPTIAINAACQHLVVVVDLSKRSLAIGAVHLAARY